MKAYGGVLLAVLCSVRNGAFAFVAQSSPLIGPMQQQQQQQQQSRSQSQSQQPTLPSGVALKSLVSDQCLVEDIGSVALESREQTLDTFLPGMNTRRSSNLMRYEPSRYGSYYNNGGRYGMDNRYRRGGRDSRYYDYADTWGASSLVNRGRGRGGGGMRSRSYDRTYDRSYDRSYSYGRSGYSGYYDDDDTWGASSLANRGRVRGRGRVGGRGTMSSPSSSIYSADMYDSPVVQGGTRSTFGVFPDQQNAVINLETDGRPLEAHLELWQGPDNTPAKVKAYSEDGNMRPFRAAVETYGDNNAVSVKNTGSMEFPMVASVGEDHSTIASGMSYGSSSYRGVYTGLNYWDYPEGDYIQGGSLKTYKVDADVTAIRLFMYTDGMPLKALVEILQGPNSVRQVAEIDLEDGRDRPFECEIETPGDGSTLSIKNIGPIEFPMTAYIEPIYDGYNGYGGGYGYGGYGVGRGMGVGRIGDYYNNGNYGSGYRRNGRYNNDYYGRSNYYGNGRYNNGYNGNGRNNNGYNGNGRYSDTYYMSSYDRDRMNNGNRNSYYDGYYGGTYDRNRRNRYGSYSYY